MVQSTSRKRAQLGGEAVSHLRDQYRRAAFDLLNAARRLRSVADHIATTKVAIAPAAVDDRTAALAILDQVQAALAELKAEPTLKMQKPSGRD